MKDKNYYWRIRYAPSDSIGGEPSRFYAWYDVSGKLGFGEIRDNKFSYEGAGGKMHLLNKLEVKRLLKVFQGYLSETKEEEIKPKD